jgi:tetratricopeptide (TPR) repeat protein
LSLALALAAPNKTLVVPFDNLSPLGTHGWIGEAFAESLTAHLLLTGQEVVSAEERRRSLREMGADPDEPATLAMLAAVSEELGAGRIIMGSFRTTDAGLEVLARVVDVPSGTTVGLVDDHGELEDLTRIENQLAKNILRLEGLPVPADFPLAAARHEAIAFDAYEAFTKAKQSDSLPEKRRLLEDALRSDPSLADASLLLGQVLLDEGEIESAIEVLRAIPPEDPAYREAYFTLGVAYLGVDQTRLAAEIFEHLAEQEKAASYSSNLGVVFLRRGEIENAVIAFREAVELEPSAIYVFNLGWAAWRAQRHHEARHWLTEAARLAPEDAEAHFLLSAVASLESDPEEAKRERARALSIAPELAEVEVSSLDGLERIVTRLPREFVSYRFPTSSSLSADATMELAPEVGSVPPVAPESAPPALSENDPAGDPIQPAGLEDPQLEDPQEHLVSARELRASGDLAGAVHALERAVYLDPYSVEIRTELAGVFEEMGELDKAAAELQVALWNHEDGPTLLRLAELYETMGELDKARALAERATELDSGDAEARELLERLLSLSGSTTSQP